MAAGAREPFHDGDSAVQRRPIAGCERRESLGEGGHATGAALFQDPCAARGRPHPSDSPVVGIRLARNELLLLERGDYPGHSGGSHLLRARERAQRDRAGVDNHGKGRQFGRGESTGVVLPAQSPQQVNRCGMQPVRGFGIAIVSCAWRRHV